MDLILICSECGYEERAEAARGLMAKVRMLNHVHREHPELSEQYKEVVDESRVRSAYEYE